MYRKVAEKQVPLASGLNLIPDSLVREISLYVQHVGLIFIIAR